MNPLLLGALLLISTAQQAQTPGINFFSMQQDVEIGTEAAREAEERMSIVRDLGLNSYVRSIGSRLARHSIAPSLQYRFRIVNSKEIDSVAFPGGMIYIRRGLAELAENEHELAAILAHEIAHAAARHGTSQLSRQLLVQAPLSIASGLSVTESWKEQLSRFGVSIGSDAAFVHYSAAQELEANLAAVQMLNAAGYAPQALVSIFAKINAPPEGDDRGPPAYVHSHPQSAALADRLRDELDAIEAPAGITVNSAFRRFASGLARLPLPADRAPAETVAAPELPNVYNHPMEYYRLSYPEGWEITPTSQNGAILAPAGGIQASGNANDLVRGVMFDLYDVSDRPMTLAQATDRLMVYLRQRNSLRMVPGAQTQTLVGGEPALRTVMISTRTARIGDSSFRVSSDIVWVVTRMYYQSLFYIALVAPEEEFARDFQPTFEQIIRSIQLR